MESRAGLATMKITLPGPNQLGPGRLVHGLHYNIDTESPKIHHLLRSIQAREEGLVPLIWIASSNFPPPLFRNTQALLKSFMSDEPPTSDLVTLHLTYIYV